MKSQDLQVHMMARQGNTWYALLQTPPPEYSSRDMMRCIQASLPRTPEPQHREGPTAPELETMEGLDREMA